MFLTLRKNSEKISWFFSQIFIFLKIFFSQKIVKISYFSQFFIYFWINDRISCIFSHYFFHCRLLFASIQAWTHSNAVNAWLFANTKFRLWYAKELQKEPFFPQIGHFLRKNSYHFGSAVSNMFYFSQLHTLGKNCEKIFLKFFFLFFSKIRKKYNFSQMAR